MINAFSLLIASTLYFLNNANSLQKNVTRQLEGTAQIVKGNVTSSLLFHDKHAAQEHLNSLIKDDTILYAGIYDENKAFFANLNTEKHFQRPDFSQYSPGLQVDANQFQLVDEIFYDDELIGYVLLVQDTSIFRDQMTGHALITLSAFIMSLIFAWALSTLLQRWLSKPIKNFVAVIEAISSSKDYSQRLTPKSNDEIGKLMKAFNTMLDAVKERDDKLKAHGEELEDLVNLRTRQLHQRSNYDALTKLPNRHFLIEQLEHQIEIAQRENSKIAVLFLDLDRFKIINDNLGHSIGDQVLKIAAERLSKAIRSNDNLARWGGDEFVIF